MKVVSDILAEAKSLAETSNTWADLSNAMFDPIDGLVVKRFPHAAERAAFRKSETYMTMHRLVEQKMEETGVMVGSKPKKSGLFVGCLDKTPHTAGLAPGKTTAPGPESPADGGMNNPETAACKPARKKLRPPVKWHGGKNYLARRIIDCFPWHRIYLEPFGGAASVLLNKPPVEVEAYNDLDLRITRLFRILQSQGPQFVERLRFIPYSQKEFEDAASYPPESSDLDKAVCDFVRWRQSFGGQGKSWSYTTSRARGGMAGDVNAWWTAIDQLPEVIDRLKRVQILHQPASRAIQRFDGPDTLIYCDPPYLHETRAANSCDVYGVEMSATDHRELASTLTSCQSKVVLSGYPSPLYDKLFRSWRRVEFDIANHSAGGKIKARKTEVLWIKD